MSPPVGRNTGNEEWGAPLEVHASLPSTNDRLMAWSREGTRPWSTVIADEQTSGRGRRGNRWESQAGLGVSMSVLVPVEPRDAPALPLRVGLVVARAVERWMPGDGTPVSVKWPNDLQIGDRKIAGILCEVSDPGGIVAGIGVNAGHDESDFPPSLRGRAGSLRSEWGIDVSPSLLAQAIFQGLRELDLRNGLSQAEVAELGRRDALSGRMLRVARVGGTGAGIASDGALLVESPSGEIVKVTSGSVELEGGL